MGDKTDEIERNVMEKLSVRKKSSFWDRLDKMAKVWLFVTICLGPTTLIIYAKQITQWLVKDGTKILIEKETVPLKNRMDIAENVILNYSRSSRKTELMITELLREQEKNYIVKDAERKVSEEARQDSIRVKLGRKPLIFNTN